MNKRNIFIYLAFIVLTAAMHNACTPGQTELQLSRHIPFNDNWLFLLDSAITPTSANFDDSQWETVHLPHDWSLRDLPVQDSIHVGPHYKNLFDGHDTGYIRGGTAWYRKHFTVDSLHHNKMVYIHFDGIMTEADIWVNGTQVGSNRYGYTPFYVDITSALNPAGSSNTLAVKVFNPENSSRWFTGAGIYRDVAISYVNPLHIKNNGVVITTPQVTDHLATVNISVNMKNHSLRNHANLEVEATITAENNRSFSVSAKAPVIESGRSSSELLSLQIPDPVLWNLENPHLYEAVVSLWEDGKMIDGYQTTFGIRTIEFSAEKGFLLNGKEVLMKGANLHHDNGILGAAAFPTAEERRVLIMKSNGYNAIRSAHNPPSQAFLDACARHGMLVIDEIFDMWQVPKRPMDYHRHFDEWWERDTRAMVMRGINNPAIVMWSIGNEITERGLPKGLATGEMLASYVRELDPTRPVTMGVNSFWDNPGMEWEDSEPIFAFLDVAGYNYLAGRYLPDHKLFPQRIMYGSETTTSQAWEYWQPVLEHPFVIGEFVWTGMDYLGEAGIGYSSLETEPTEAIFLLPWPWYISATGDLDILGNKKPQSFYRDVVWGNSRLEMAVNAPIPPEHHVFVHYWGWPEEYPCWNWENENPDSLWVNVYSSYPSLKLELNGQPMGARELDADNHYQPASGKPIQWAFKDNIGDEIWFRASFRVPWQPGELTVTGLENGVEKEIRTLSTTGPPHKIRLHLHDNQISAADRDIIFVMVDATDGSGNPVPRADIPLQVSVTGAGHLVAAGNGNPLVQGSFTNGLFSLYRGKAMVVARSNGQKGPIHITVDSPLGEETITVESI